MNSALKNTMIAMATAALGFAGGCGGDAETESASTDSTTGGEGTEASCGGAATGTEASCGASTGDTNVDNDAEVEEGGEASCGEGSCG